MFDEQRFEALKKGATGANPRGNVAIRVADMRWMLEQIETLRGKSATEAKPETKGAK